MMHGLIPNFDVVIPTADHRICVRHLYVNFWDKGFRRVALKELLWAAASAYTDIEFRYHMEEIKKLNPAAFRYLEKIDPSGWSRSWFNDYLKCDLLVNNISECFNSYILKAREKPILTMLEMIRKQLQRKYQLKRDGIKTLKGKLCPRIVDKLEAIGEEAAIVSLLPNCIGVVDDAYMVWITYLWHFFFLHHGGVQTQSEGCISSIKGGTNPAKNSKRGGAQPHNKRVSIGSHF
jgi:hypothetical protein